MSDYKHIEQLLERLDRVDQASNPFDAAKNHREAYAVISAMLEVVRTAEKLRDDLLLRAEIGTHDGDHSVQAGNSVWHNICEAIAAVEKG